MTIEQAFRKLAKSPFRSRFHLSEDERTQAEKLGDSRLRAHAADLIAVRLAPAAPQNDGRQTPMRGHPFFVAQHACACCCRDCLQKWYHVPKGVSLTAEQQEKIVNLLMAWINKEMQ